MEWASLPPRLQMAVVQVRERASHRLGFVVGSFFRRRSRGREGRPTVRPNPSKKYVNVIEHTPFLPYTRSGDTLRWIFMYGVYE